MRYIIAALPRSRTYWMKEALTYLEEVCLHDPSVSSLDYLKCSGIADTGAVFHQEELELKYPKASWIVIDRPIEQVIKSIKKMGHPSDWVYSMEEKLEEAKKKAVLVVPYNKINSMGPAIWEACTVPYDFDKNWWSTMCSVNLQADLNHAQITTLLRNFK